MAESCPPVRKHAVRDPANRPSAAKSRALEESLGTKLFNRRPFALLPRAWSYTKFIRPFFDEIHHVGEAIRGGSAQQLRVAAPAMSCTNLSRKFCGVCGNVFRPSGSLLHEAARAEANDSCRRAKSIWPLTVIEHKKRSGIRSRALLELPLILLVNATQCLTRADKLWGRDKIEGNVNYFSAQRSCLCSFSSWSPTTRRGMVPGIEVNSARLIECYVAHGYGIGLSVATPGFKTPKGISRTEVTEFSKVMIGAA